MKVVWSPNALRDFRDWAKTDLKIHAKIVDLIADIKRNPFKGLGKPEPLKYLDGLWSRRITGEHRLVYQVSGKGRDQKLEIVQCRYHY